MLANLNIHFPRFSLLHVHRARIHIWSVVGMLGFIVHGKAKKDERGQNAHTKASATRAIDPFRRFRRRAVGYIINRFYT